MKLLWLPEALDDLERIAAFLIERNPRAAGAALEAIGEGADQLTAYPEIGRPMADAAGRRELFVPFGAGAYVLRYRIHRDTLVVEWSDSLPPVAGRASRNPQRMCLGKEATMPRTRLARTLTAAALTWCLAAAPTTAQAAAPFGSIVHDDVRMVVKGTTAVWNEEKRQLTIHLLPFEPSANLTYMMSFDEGIVSGDLSGRIGSGVSSGEDSLSGSTMSWDLDIRTAILGSLPRGD